MMTMRIDVQIRFERFLRVFFRSSYFFHLFHDTESAGVASQSTQLKLESESDV